MANLKHLCQFDDPITFIRNRVFLSFVVLWAFGLTFQLTISAQDQPGSHEHTIKIVQHDGETYRFVIVGLDLDTEELQQATVKVWLAGTDYDEFPPMAGRTEIENKTLIFTPKYPLRVGSEFHLRIEGKADSSFEFQDHVVSLPKKELETSRIVSIHPTANEIPANILKFYIHFSAPMRKGNVYEHVKIRKSDGEVIEFPFLEIEQEFWSRDSKRLTLLLDPGRIKRGLKPREELGPIFEPGGNYELVISGNWLDGNGTPLKKGGEIVKKYSANDEDHEQPDPAEWKFNSPKVGTQDPLVIRFDESLDHSMLERVLTIKATKGRLLKGSIEVSTDATQFQFKPLTPWQNAEYLVEVATNLEDLAGNSIGRPFEVDAFESEESPILETVSIPFKLMK